MPRIFTERTFWNLRSIMVNKSFNAWGVVFNGSMTESNDYFEPRVWGENFIRPIWTIAEHGFPRTTKSDLRLMQGSDMSLSIETIGGNGIMMPKLGFRVISDQLVHYAKLGGRVFNSTVRAMPSSFECNPVDTM